MDLIFERGTHALSEFQEVDNIFAQLKKTDFNKSRKLVLRLETVLESIFGTDVIIELQNHGSLIDNFAVLPILKPTPEITRNIINPTAIKLYDVQKLHFFIGVELIETSKPRQLTAILLHEIGHVIQHVSVMSERINSILSNIRLVSQIMGYIPLISLIFLPIFVITTRTLNFRNHINEYHADKFATQYGYGDDLIKWCLINVKEKQTEKINLIKIFSTLHRFLFGSSHPSFDKRILAVIEEMKSKYSKEYGNAKIEKLLNEYYKINNIHKP